LSSRCLAPALHASLGLGGRLILSRDSAPSRSTSGSSSITHAASKQCSYILNLILFSQITRDDLEKSKRERAAAAKKRGKVSSEDSDVQAGILAAQMPPPMEVAGQEQDEIWKLQAQVQLRRRCRFHLFVFLCVRVHTGY
jgi:hypothetical protein